MKIKDPTTRAVFSAIAALIVFVLCLKIFGVFQTNMSFREELRAAKPAVAISFVIACLGFFAADFFTKLDTRTIEGIQLSTSVNGDVNLVQADLSRLGRLVRDLPRTNKVAKVVSLIIEVINIALEKLIKTLEVEDMTDAQDLRILTSDLTNAVRQYSEDLNNQRFDADAQRHVADMEAKVSSLMVGFVRVMKKVADRDTASMALNNLEMKMRAWGYLGELDVLELKDKPEKE